MTNTFYSTYRIKGDPYLRLDADRIEDEGRSEFWEDDTGYIRIDAPKGKCKQGVTVPCGNTCRKPENCKKRATPAQVQPTSAVPAKTPSKASINSKKKTLTREEAAKNLDRVEKKVGEVERKFGRNSKEYKTAVAEERSAFALLEKMKDSQSSKTESSVSVAKPKGVQKTAKKQSAKSEAVKQEAPKKSPKTEEVKPIKSEEKVSPSKFLKSTKLGAAAEITQDQIDELRQKTGDASIIKHFFEKPHRDGSVDADKTAKSYADTFSYLLSSPKPDSSVGKAAHFAKGAPIKSQKDFDATFDGVYKSLNDEFKMDDLVPIYRVRRAMGDRVSRGDFDRFLANKVANDDFSYTEGTVEDNSLDKVMDSVYTKVSGIRAYIKK